MNRIILFICLVLFTCIKIHGQKQGFRKDSLQIKVYSEAVYVKGKVTEINILKTFCEYCSQKQLDFLKLFAWRETYNKKYDKKYWVQNGKSKMALYIRVPKKEFRALRENLEE